MDLDACLHGFNYNFSSSNKTYTWMKRVIMYHIKLALRPFLPSIYSSSFFCSVPARLNTTRTDVHLHLLFLTCFQ